jgi:RHS repeat-associated protein
LKYNAWGAATWERFGTDRPVRHESGYNVRGRRYFTSAATEDAPASAWWNRGLLVTHYATAELAGGAWGVSGTDNVGQARRTHHLIPGDDAITRFQANYEDLHYDWLGRLTAAALRTYDETGNNQPLGVQGYDYDRYGNRTVSAGTWGAGINNKQFTVNAANNRLGVPAGQAGVMAYDAAGNLIQDTYTRSNVGDGIRQYDADGRLTLARVTGGGTETSAYGAGGERTSITGADGTTTRFVYGIDGELLAEYRGSFAATAPEVEYGYRGGEQLITARADETRWHIRDDLGTARIALDQTGSLANVRRTDHLPFGEDLTGGIAGRTAARGYAPTNERNKFTGHARDQGTGYDHTLWRKLDSVQGRWTSPDPYGGSMEIGNPQSFNRYAYVLNDPVNASDPLGLFQAAPKADYSGLWSLWLGRQELLEVALQPVGQGGGGQDETINGGTAVATKFPLIEDIKVGQGKKLGGGDIEVKECDKFQVSFTFSILSDKLDQAEAAASLQLDDITGKRVNRLGVTVQAKKGKPSTFSFPDGVKNIYTYTATFAFQARQSIGGTTGNFPYKIQVTDPETGLTRTRMYSPTKDSKVPLVGIRRRNESGPCQ